MSMDQSARDVVRAIDECMPGRRIGGPPAPDHSAAHAAAAADVERLFAELPVDMGLTALGRWLDARGLPADPAYRREFRRLGLVRRMRESSRP